MGGARKGFWHAAEFEAKLTVTPMHKVPALLLVGVIAGMVGAGMMWLFMRDSRDPALAPAPAESRERATANRIGIPESYQPDAEREAAAAGAPQVDPKILGAMAGQAGRSTEAESRGSAHVEGGGGAFTGFPTFPPTVRVAANPLTQGVWRVALSARTNVTEELEDALMAALEAAMPFVKSGFTVREDHWAGTIEGTPLAITHQLFRGNEYWFWAGAERAAAGIDLHIYDSAGNLAESEHSRLRNAAAARVVPANTGTYYMIVSQKPQNEAAKRRQAHWALVYGYR